MRIRPRLARAQGQSEHMGKLEQGKAPSLGRLRFEAIYNERGAESQGSQRRSDAEKFRSAFGFRSDPHCLRNSLPGAVSELGKDIRCWRGHNWGRIRVPHFHVPAIQCLL